MLNKILTRFLQRFFFSLHFSYTRKNLYYQEYIRVSEFYQFRQFMTSNNTNGHRILPVGLGGWTLRKIINSKMEVERPWITQNSYRARTSRKQWSLLKTVVSRELWSEERESFPTSANYWPCSFLELKRKSLAEPGSPPHPSNKIW